MSFAAAKMSQKAFAADDQSKLMADILANLGSFVLEKKEEADPANPRRPSHH